MGLWYPYIQNQLSASESADGGTVCKILDMSLHPQINLDNGNSTGNATEQVNKTDAA